MEIALVNSSILKTTYRVQLLKYYEIICCNSYMINLKAELAQSRFIFSFSWTSLSVSILNSNFKVFMVTTIRLQALTTLESTLNS